ncbi:OmpH family outer membrane protein [Novosphingobium mangrovi (ex Hu et al. 2023)]|uniref:OmpH family outer membrane protein n=1 Tax=Novosphingobium mangrovi (ex Hu et al. 2023) TaxID=2930094 RepID=A0ABT0A8Q7_9SPHN|nr:OmpH family outer membrane protein [Novosphingobium mangrovi (ex Hu et al. 2023)]MCJ1959588.1 OmpH family outer membrane protein [Novosphingobium mangrovi (ex Hu et al. 2023)]
MKTLLKSAALASTLALASVALPGVASAQSGTVVPGIGVADLEGIVFSSAANQTAREQRQTTYKAQIDQANSRRAAIQAQLQPLIQKYQADSRAANPNEAALQQQAQQIQQIQQQGQQELQQILAPVSLSEAYVNEQIEDKLNDAVKAAMTKKKVTILLNPQSIQAITDGAYSLNQDILAELNAAIPTAQIVPPEGWEPRQVREARARQQQAGQAQAPAAGNTAAPAGR